MKIYPSFILSAALLSPLTVSAQGFTRATCLQTNSYLGGYSVGITPSATDANSIQVELAHYLGPDGDGFYQDPILLTGTLSSSVNGQDTYTLSNGDGLILNLNGKTGVFQEITAGAAAAQTTLQDFDLTCTFGSPVSPAATPETACGESLRKLDASLVTRDGKGVTFRGFDSAAYQEGAPTRASVVLETKTEYYYYSETSDISASLYVCEKDSAKAQELVQSHAIECSDLPAVNAADVLYTACAK